VTQKTKNAEKRIHSSVTVLLLLLLLLFQLSILKVKGVKAKYLLMKVQIMLTTFKNVRKIQVTTQPGQFYQ
jgi:cell division protein FtsB